MHAFLSAPQWGNRAEMQTLFRKNSGLRLYSWRGGSICSAGICSKSDTKEWILPQFEVLLLFSCQPMFLFVFFLTVPKFILLFLNRHISYLHMLSHGNGVGASEAVCWLLFSLSLSLSLPVPCSSLQHSFAMPFHPLPSYC